MDETEVGTGQDSPDKSDKDEPAARVRSTIGFPYFGIEEAVNIARIVHDSYGGRCEIDQLAASLKQKPASGGFRLKLSSARLFGLVTTNSGTVSITGLGSLSIDSHKGPAARVTAFLNAPLFRALFERFRGRTLPSDKGLEAAIADLGVSAKQVTTARQVFQRSADYAGFFAHGRDRLVLPAAGTLDINGAEDAGGDDHASFEQDHDESESTSVMTDPLITGLLKRLPDPKAGFSETERKVWLSTLEMNLALIYSAPKEWVFDRPAPPQPENTGPFPVGDGARVFKGSEKVE